jgi:hypothetical protein
MPLVFGRSGYLKIGTAVYPALNVQIATPRTLMVPPMVGRDWQWNYADGVRVTRLNAQILIRDVVNEALSATFLNLFLSRTSGDTGSVTVEADDGARKITVSNAKGEFLGLSVGKGDMLIWNVTFVSPTPPTFAARSAFTAPDASAPLTFQNVAFTGAGAEVYSFEFGVTNNHVANAPITDNTGANVGLGAQSYDAGLMQVGATFTFKTQTGSPIADGSSVTLTISGTSSKTRTFTFQYLVSQNPEDEAFAIGPVFKTIRYTVLGTAANPPVTIGGTGF